jgi:hypothetical protein
LEFKTGHADQYRNRLLFTWSISMDGHGVRKPVVVTPTTVITLLSIVLAASLGLNLWQYGVFQGQHSLAASSKAAATLAEAKRLELELERKTARAKADKRVDQLYKELDNLGRLSDQLLDGGQRPGIPSRTRDQSVEPARVP